MSDRGLSAEEIVRVALDLPPEARRAFIDSACRGQPELRRSVEQSVFDVQPPAPSQDTGSISASPTLAETSAVNPNLIVGKKFGRYTVIEPLGFGGMGAVFRARDERLERLVAIKFLAPGMLTGEQLRSRFHKEALALAKLSHSHIAAVYDVGQQDGIDYIVMECVPGESLAARLKSGPLPLREATAILLQMAEALEEAHERGVVHRDLKPANIMLTPKGQVKVLDFGIAKLLAAQPSDVTASMETRGLIGTPLYMSPEQTQGIAVDARTDLWSAGVVFYEALTGKSPFHAGSSLAVMRSITETEPTPLREICLDAPPLAERILKSTLAKDPAQRYASASALAHDATALLNELGGVPPADSVPSRRVFSVAAVAVIVALLLAAAAGGWLYHRSSQRHWAGEKAPAQIADLLDAKRSLAAFLLLQQAQKYLPSDPRLHEIAADATRQTSITSSPSGATVEMQDYIAPDSPWHRVGVTPIANVLIPKGYFRWKVTTPSGSTLVAAPRTEGQLNFAVDAAKSLPSGMVSVPGGMWTESVDFIGWLGPYKLPPYDVDRYEVTNREYQKFVDSHGYENKQYWQEKFTQNGHDLSWDQAMAYFRDTSGRPGPSTWVAGHYPEGQADFPVSGVSWFEASAYAVFAGKRLPVLAQWFNTAEPELSRYILPVSNFSGKALAPVGSFKGIGPYGTYDMAGNVREWVANLVDGDQRFILGGSWKSPSYLYFDPEALSAFDRTDTNGFRCVLDHGPLPPAAEMPIHRSVRDFATFKPAPDSVFNAYKLLYEYPNLPLNAKSEGIVKETADWREEKVTFNTGYSDERMAAYLFLPKKVQPPYQTVLFYPSARVLFIPSNNNGRDLGDLKFFDYIVQSGRAVMYPIFQETYERREQLYFPSGSQQIGFTIDSYKDAARSLDYLATRHDIDGSKLAYLGVSMGSAEGVIISTLLQDRLKTAIFLDGGYFLNSPPPGGDQADFAPRLKIPVLMVNGRYDFTFPVDQAQDPLFTMLGTPAKDKSHIILDTPHDVTEQRPRLVQSVLDWLDHYLGRVNE